MDLRGFRDRRHARRLAQRFPREYRNFVKESFIRNIRLFSRHDLPYTIELWSDEFFSAWAAREKLQDVLGREITLGGPISFCYIDGNHTYDFAKRDFENTDKHLESGGFILFDDSSPDLSDDPWLEAWRVAQEALASGRYELVKRNPNYFLQKRTNA